MITSMKPAVPLGPPFQRAHDVVKAPQGISQQTDFTKSARVLLS